MKDLIIKNVTVVDGRGGEPFVADIHIARGIIDEIAGARGDVRGENFTRIIDGAGLIAAPGFVDIHVHFRDPGFTEKEDIVSGGEAAAAGGFTTVCCMPNTSPAIHEPDVLLDIDRRARAAGKVNLLAVSALTRGQAGTELVDFAAMDAAATRCRELTGHGVAGVSEDGKTLDDEGLMRKVLSEAGRLGLPVMDHAEPEVEITKRNIRFARETAAHIHIQHISTKAAVDALRDAKKELPNITCETAPHYFTLTSEALSRLGPNAKMNPPLKGERDREAVLEGIADGTIDCIATDHAPHTAAEKARPVNEAPFGIIGLETCFPLAYTRLVKTGILTLPQLIDKMSAAPARLIGLSRGRLSVGKAADIVLIDPSCEGRIDSAGFRSKARNTPFDGMPVSGRITHTLLNGKITYERTL
jgi:dihydroorotase